MQKISQIIKNKKIAKDNVNNVNVGNENKYINNVNKKIKKAFNKLMNLLDEKENKPKFIAELIQQRLGDDPKNLKFHLKMAQNIKEEFLFECLSIALDAHRNRVIKKTLPRYYVGILKRKGLLTKIKK